MVMNCFSLMSFSEKILRFFRAFRVRKRKKKRMYLMYLICSLALVICGAPKVRHLIAKGVSPGDSE